MAGESKAEREVRKSIMTYLAPDETLREFTRVETKSLSISVAYFFSLIIGEILAQRYQTGYFVGLTDKRLILVEFKGKTPTGNVQSIPLSDIKGLLYNRGLVVGNLEIHRTTETIKFDFEVSPWYQRAINMAKLLPLAQ